MVLSISTMIIYLHKANAPSIPVAPYKTAQRCSHTYANEQLSTSSIDPMVQYFVIPSLHRLWKVSPNQRRLYTSSGGHQRNLLEKKQIRRLLWKNNRKRHKAFIFKLFVSFKCQYFYLFSKKDFELLAALKCKPAWSRFGNRFMEQERKENVPLKKKSSHTWAHTHIHKYKF